MISGQLPEVVMIENDEGEGKDFLGCACELSLGGKVVARRDPRVYVNI